MYASAFVLGFHGCDRSVGEKILAGKDQLKPSGNDYDWLGTGIYFWENSPLRAEHWARFIQSRPKLFHSKVTRPFVLGAIIDLGLCLDLTEASSLKQLKTAHRHMRRSFKVAGVAMPENLPGGNQDQDLVRRKLDCAVVNYLHSLRQNEKLSPFDSVRGAFWEGSPLYTGSRIMKKTHIQICVRDARSIRGYFRPRPESE